VSVRSWRNIAITVIDPSCWGRRLIIATEDETRPGLTSGFSYLLVTEIVILPSASSNSSAA
jgi:hypothetical protein